MLLPRPACKANRSEEHTSELQSRRHRICRLLLEKNRDGFEPDCFAGDAAIGEKITGNSIHALGGAVQGLQVAAPLFIEAFFLILEKTADITPVPPQRALQV